MVQAKWGQVCGCSLVAVPPRDRGGYGLRVLIIGGTSVGTLRRSWWQGRVGTRVRGRGKRSREPGLDRRGGGNGPAGPRARGVCRVRAAADRLPRSAEARCPQSQRGRPPGVSVPFRVVVQLLLPPFLLLLIPRGLRGSSIESVEVNCFAPGRLREETRRTADFVKPVLSCSGPSEPARRNLINY